MTRGLASRAFLMSRVFVSLAGACALPRGGMQCWQVVVPIMFFTWHAPPSYFCSLVFGACMRLGARKKKKKQKTLALVPIFEQTQRPARAGRGLALTLCAPVCSWH